MKSDFYAGAEMLHERACFQGERWSLSQVSHRIYVTYTGMKQMVEDRREGVINT